MKQRTRRILISRPVSCIKKTLHITSLASAFCCTLSLMLLFACGGGGAGPGSPVFVSGVAASGAPIFGFVTLKDQNGYLSGPAIVHFDGSFSLDVTGFTPPFVLKVKGSLGAESLTLYAVAWEAGTVHINPFSNLALMLATGSDPALVYQETRAIPDTTKISETSLSEAVAQIKTFLSPLLSTYGITDFDPLNGHYSATPDNRLDAMLDVISFKTENGLLTVRNRLDGTIIASGNVANLADIALDGSKFPDEGVLGDIREITQRLGVLCSTMNLGASLTSADLEDFFVSDPDYGTSSGYTRAQEIAAIREMFKYRNGNGSLRPLTDIRNVRLVSDQTANYSGRGVSKAYLLNYEFTFEYGPRGQSANATFGRETSSGLWKFIGDPVGSVIGNNHEASYKVIVIEHPAPCTYVPAPCPAGFACAAAVDGN